MQPGPGRWLSCQSPLSNAGLAAAILQGQRRSDTNSNNRVCYNCGKPGHMRRDFQALVKGKVLGLCTRCGKGYHRASECPSIKDVRGRFIQSGPQAERSEDNSKNEFLGPRSQGPKTYGIPCPSSLGGHYSPQSCRSLSKSGSLCHHSIHADTLNGDAAHSH